MTKIQSLLVSLLVLIAGFGATFSSNAQTNGVETQVGNNLEQPSYLSQKLSEYVAVGDWQFSLAMGAGKRTSPLVGTMDQNLLLIPSMSFYGERFYFDNGRIGYTLKERQTYSLSIAAELSPITSQYFDLHPANLILGSDNFDNTVLNYSEVPSSNHLDNNQDQKDEQSPQPLSFEKPDWSIDAGITWSWFIDDSQQINTQIYTDITDVHNGQRIELDWSKSMQLIDILPTDSKTLQPWQVQVRLGLSIYDKKSSQYYFGIDDRHTEDTGAHYQLNHAINPHVSIFMSRNVFVDWRLVMFYKNLSLDNGIYHSPRTDARYIHTFFVGLAYDF